ncbi:tRNA pseudouridine(55) synthase TruB [Tranquillimonas rosea]|uniref:tRNA pseudouridine(55) synthase TruB n=1 Tax=Tranquillimonas rosea TaxID=641238 RepID=UPI003BAB91FD
MGRRKKGRAVSGWVIVDKPAGMTSTAVVNKLRWAFDAKKAGHAGTLDPDATGLLAVALGEATKTIPFITDAEKAYRFTVRLGAATDTDDAAGRVLDTSDLRPDTETLRAALSDFVGDIMQVPPQYSAVRLEGERAYDIARSGEEMELEARPLHVASLTLIDRPDNDHAELEMVCGKGGYVRSIARDLGRQLGCLGHVVSLRRMWSGPFEIDQAVTLDELEPLYRTEEIDRFLGPVEAGLADLPQVRLSAEGAMRMKNGNPGAVVSADATFGDVAWGSYQGQPVGIGTYRAGALHPSRVFNL